MAASNKPQGANAGRARTARVKRQLTGLSLGMLLASFAAVVATGVPTPAPDLLSAVIAGPQPAGDAAAPAPANATVLGDAVAAPRPQIGPRRIAPVSQAQTPSRRARTRMS